MKKLTILFSNNCYPLRFIHSILRDNDKPKSLPSTEPTKYYKFPYIPDLSGRLKQYLNKQFPGCGLAFYNIKKVGNLFTKLKATDPLEQQSNLVYKIDCQHCAKCYIGQTKQLLKARLYQHKNDCRERNLGMDKERTGLAQHCITEGHHFDFINVKILDRESHLGKRLISEMVHIKKTKNYNVNIRSDIEKLSNNYTGLMEM